MNSVAWTLSYEMAFYLALPLIVGGFVLHGQSRRARVVLWTVAAVAISAGCVAGLWPVHFLLFIAGILLCEALGSLSWRPGDAVATVAFAVALLAAGLPLEQAITYALCKLLIAMAFVIVCLEVFREPAGDLTRALSWTPLRWFGNMSYSYYLIHGLALNGLVWLAGMVLRPDESVDLALYLALAPLAFAVTLPPAVVLYLAVERPFSLRRPPRPRS
jgi:peptidoglycan/LPS O-acetylase OafA/YrhL